MPAYALVQIDITDAEGYEEVKRRTPAVVHAFGGRYLARGGRTERLEGTWEPERLVVLEFADLEAIHAWLASPEYAAIRVLRDATARVSVVAVEGLAEDRL